MHFIHVSQQALHSPVVQAVGGWLPGLDAALRLSIRVFWDRRGGRPVGVPALMPAACPHRRFIFPSTATAALMRSAPQRRCVLPSASLHAPYVVSQLGVRDEPLCDLPPMGKHSSKMGQGPPRCSSLQTST